MVDDNFKDHLMRCCQTNNYELPEYRVLSQENGLFVIGAIVQNRQLGQGYAKSKKQAEQNAARSVFLPAFGGGDLPKSNVANVPPIKHHQPLHLLLRHRLDHPRVCLPKTVKIHKFRDESEIIR